MFKKIIAKFKKYPLRFGGIVVILIIIIALFAFRNGSSTEETLTVTRGEFLVEVSGSGKVIAAQSSNLGFDQSGRIATINAKVGDRVLAGATLASIDNGSIRADITQKQASLEREQAKLASLRRGTRPEQLALTQQKYVDASSALTIAMRDAYLKTENALLSQVDTVFEDGNSVNPTIIIATNNETKKKSIQNERLITTEKLDAWKKALAGMQSSASASTIQSIRAKGTDSLMYTRAFIDHLGDIASRLDSGNSGLTQSSIDETRDMINTAGQAVSAAISIDQVAYAAWAVAANNLVLERSGSTAEDISAQEAQVKAAEADLANAQAQLRKTIVTAPFDGIVTKMDAKIGEIVSPGSSSIAMIGTGLFEIESYIPEVNIARLSINNPASVTLDAYGSDTVFSASVIMIDPAETVRDGVSTYKTTLRFSAEDPRIKPGMTANIRITTERKSDTISIPRSVITETDGVKTVRIRSGESIINVPIETGSMTALGNIEVTSGLSEGDVLVLPPLE